MNKRIENLKTYIQDLNQGVREKNLYEYVGESLKQTEGEPVQIRRAKAFQNVMERTPQLVLPYELITGTMLGQCPLKKDVLSKEDQKKKAIETMEAYLDEKKRNVAVDEIVYDEEHIKSFEESFQSKKSRWSLMARVYQDSSVPYDDLQDLIAEMKEMYEPQGLEAYEVLDTSSISIMERLQKQLQMDVKRVNHSAIVWDLAREKISMDLQDY